MCPWHSVVGYQSLNGIWVLWVVMALFVGSTWQLVLTLSNMPLPTGVMIGMMWGCCVQNGLACELKTGVEEGAPPLPPKKSCLVLLCVGNILRCECEPRCSLQPEIGRYVFGRGGVGTSYFELL